MKRIHLIAIGLVCTAMLLGALGSWPYGYYTLLRIVVCIGAGFFAAVAYSTDKQWILWPCVAVAILFNPLLPVHLSRDIWAVIDFVCALLFLIPTFVLRVPNNLKPPPAEINQ